MFSQVAPHPAGWVPCPVPEGFPEFVGSEISKVTALLRAGAPRPAPDFPWYPKFLGVTSSQFSLFFFFSIVTECLGEVLVLRHRIIKSQSAGVGRDLRAPPGTPSCSRP